MTAFPIPDSTADCRLPTAELRFETERLLLRPRTLADLEACIAMDRDPDVTRFVPGPWSDPDAHRAFVSDRIERRYPPGMGYWSVFPKSDPEEFLGWILLTPLDLVGPDIEIGWRLRRSARGRGYAAEAARPVLGHALETLRLAEIVADIDPANAASIRVAEKIGMRFSGQRPGGLLRYSARPNGTT
jgi:RimJ/RimL family protein N-acetyltransferase